MEEFTMYQRKQIADIMNISVRTLQRLIIREKIKIKPKVRLSKKDIELIESKLQINLKRYLN